MGTKAAFYIKNRRRCVGAIGADGFPDEMPDALLDACTEEAYIREVGKVLDEAGMYGIAGHPPPIWIIDHDFFFIEGSVWWSDFPPEEDGELGWVRRVPGTYPGVVELEWRAKLP